jgi:hypothetical protein
MISTQDKLLSECHPNNLTWKEFLKDCERAINTSEVHSDEWSSDDEELADEERKNNLRKDKIKNSNSVIKIYDKKWRSSRVCKVVKLLNKYNIYT